MRPLNRIVPKLPVESMTTFSISSPAETHTRPGTCEEADCAAQRHGWRTTVDETTDLGMGQAHYIRNDSGRQFTEDHNPATGTTTFTFEAGQKCFTQHRISLERPELYLVRGGDWRGNPRGTQRVHSGPDAWLNEFGEHQDKLRKAQG